jgi:hypothetical protein
MFEEAANTVAPEQVTVDDPQFIVPAVKNPEVVKLLLFVVSVGLPLRTIFPQEKALLKVLVPPFICVAFPGMLTPFVDSVTDEPVRLNVLEKTPENAVTVPDVQANEPATLIPELPDVGLKVTTPAETVQSRQASVVPVIVTM